MSSSTGTSVVKNQKKGPDWAKNYMEKTLAIKLNGNRRVVGTLAGYDVFMNLILENCREEKPSSESEEIGTVVIRGSSVIQFECLDRL